MGSIVCPYRRSAAVLRESSYSLVVSRSAHAANLGDLLGARTVGGARLILVQRRPAGVETFAGLRAASLDHLKAAASLCSCSKLLAAAGRRHCGNAWLALGTPSGRRRGVCHVNGMTPGISEVVALSYSSATSSSPERQALLRQTLGVVFNRFERRGARLVADHERYPAGESGRNSARCTGSNCAHGAFQPLVGMTLVNPRSSLGCIFTR